MANRFRKKWFNLLRIAICVLALWIVVRGVTINDKVVLQTGEEVVGTVTEAVYSPRLDKNIAVALLNSEIADDEQGLEADIGEERRTATVSKLPFC